MSLVGKYPKYGIKTIKCKKNYYRNCRTRNEGQICFWTKFRCLQISNLEAIYTLGLFSLVAQYLKIWYEIVYVEIVELKTGNSLISFSNEQVTDRKQNGLTLQVLASTLDQLYLKNRNNKTKIGNNLFSFKYFILN